MSSIQEKPPFDVVIVGAGIAGIGIAYELQQNRPDLRFIILEARGAIGGTWDVFKYPGIRSDSDLHTFSFPWHPWSGPLIGDGASIRNYIEDAAATQGIDRHIHFNHDVTSADWREGDQLWRVETTATMRVLSARFIVFGTGLYDLKNPSKPDIPGLDQFSGLVIHPQSWPGDLDYTDENIVVIGSGATAITLLPVLAEKASRVIMLQRSPTYIFSLPKKDPLAFLPTTFKRALWILGHHLTYTCIKACPRIAKQVLCYLMGRQLPKGVEADPNFRPRYNPWDQRICMSPDGDLFAALRQGNADVKTGTIDRVTEKGILLDSGETLTPDIIVTATGCAMQTAGGTRILINGRECALPEKFSWNGCMIEDIPNAFVVVGYPYISWTIGVQVTARRILRLFGYMDEQGFKTVVPRLNGGEGMELQNFYGFNSTYVTTGQSSMPKMGDRYPWMPRINFFRDYMDVRWGPLGRDLEFS